MSPSKTHYNQRLINGLGSSSHLKINKDSHQIQKSSSSSSSSGSSSSGSSFNGVNGVITPVSNCQQHQQQQRQPVIIYTHSPKVIHAKPSNFMALVQTLTGLSHSDSPQSPQKKQIVSLSDTNTSNDNNNVKRSSDSVVTEENYAGIRSDIQVRSSPVSSPDTISSHYINDIPIFTPSSLDYLYPSRSFYRLPNSLMSFPKMGNPISSHPAQILEESQYY